MIYGKAFSAAKSLAGVAAAALLLTGAPATAANNAPIVLVHGFLGFGPDELTGTGFHYWGGFTNLAGHMRTGGHQVFEAGVGPVSSNWDRAVELYYQIKGGCADYGAAHTAQYASFGALRQPAGKCWAADPANNPQHYPLALYPAWDAAHPIHFIAHSQGGQTVRTLIQLLEHGSPNGDEGGAELYRGGKLGWVISASTIATPHNGTTLRDVVVDFVPKVSDWAGQIVALAGLGGSTSPLYKFRLEQFGLAQGTGESDQDFLARTRSAPFWSLANHDAAQWDLGPDGARELNAWVGTAPDVVYFSLGSVATERGSWCCNGTDRVIAPFQDSRYQYPRTDMMVFTKNTAGEWVVPSILQRGMGSYTQNSPGRVAIDASWFPNDGVVNTVSMRSPAGQPVRAFSGTPVRGSWNYLGYYAGYDHFDVLGWLLPTSSFFPIYDQLAAQLYAL